MTSVCFPRMAILPTSLQKVEPQTGTDLPRSGIEIEAADSSKHQRPAVEHAQHLPVFGRYTGAGSTHGPWGNRCVQRCPRCAGVHASSSCSVSRTISHSTKPRSGDSGQTSSRPGRWVQPLRSRKSPSVGVTACSQGPAARSQGWLYRI